MTFMYAQAQELTTEEVLEEGQMLYRLEWISEYGSNVFYKLFGDEDRRKFGFRQISYLDEKGQFVNFYYDYYEGTMWDDHVTYQIMLRIRFDNPFDLQPEEIPPQPAIVDTCNKVPTQEELSLITMCQDVNKQIGRDNNHIFKPYNHAIYEKMPIIFDGRRSVFVFPLPHLGGPVKSVLFGGDYRFEYDISNTLIKWDELHDTLIELPDHSGEVLDQIKSLTHKLTYSWSITPVDVFTLLKYGDRRELKRQYEMGNNMFYPAYDREREELIMNTIREFLNRKEQE